jgi:F-type H+-transporting ATPase subunit delta
LSSNKSFSTETSERYALALFELSKENSELDTVEKNVRDFLELYISSQELENFVKNPTQLYINQIKVIKEISKIMKFSQTLEKFLSILVVKRRIF